MFCEAAIKYSSSRLSHHTHNGVLIQAQNVVCRVEHWLDSVDSDYVGRYSKEQFIRDGVALERLLADTAKRLSFAVPRQVIFTRRNVEWYSNRLREVLQRTQQQLEEPAPSKEGTSGSAFAGASVSSLATSPKTNRRSSKSTECSHVPDSGIESVTPTWDSASETAESATEIESDDATDIELTYSAITAAATPPTSLRSRWKQPFYRRVAKAGCMIWVCLFCLVLAMLHQNYVFQPRSFGLHLDLTHEDSPPF